MIKANTNLIGKEVFYIGWTLQRGIVIEQDIHGVKVQKDDGTTDFFPNAATETTLEDAIFECKTNEMMWRNEADKLQRELDEKEP